MVQAEEPACAKDFCVMNIDLELRVTFQISAPLLTGCVSLDKLF